MKQVAYASFILFQTMTMIVRNETSIQYLFNTKFVCVCPLDFLYISNIHFIYTENYIH